MPLWAPTWLLQHIYDLEIFLKNEKIDICLISETHLIKQSFVKIKVYYIFRSDHPVNKLRGGFAAIIKDSIKHQEEMKIELEMMQVTIVKVQAKNKEFNISQVS